MKLLLFLHVFFLPFAAQALCVSASKANLRKGPGTKFDKSWTVGRHMPFVKVGAEGNWYKVKDQDGELHWIHARLVTWKVNCLAVKVSVSSLRQGPGANYPLAEFSYTDRYTPFKEVDIQGDWFQIEDVYGASYWIHRNNVWRPLRVSNVSF